MPPGKRGRRETGTARTSRYRCSGLLGIRCPDKESGLEAEDEAEEEEESGAEEEASPLAAASF